jgi:hypothetical protein
VRDETFHIKATHSVGRRSARAQIGITFCGFIDRTALFSVRGSSLIRNERSENRPKVRNSSVERKIVSLRFCLPLQTGKCVLPLLNACQDKYRNDLILQTVLHFNRLGEYLVTLFLPVRASGLKLSNGTLRFV